MCVLIICNILRRRDLYYTIHTHNSNPATQNHPKGALEPLEPKNRLHTTRRLRADGGFELGWENKNKSPVTIYIYIYIPIYLYTYIYI